MVPYVLDLLIVLHGLLSSAGVVGNLINIVVFKRQGLKESMSVGFFALSLSDFLYCLLNLGMCFCFLADLVVPDNGVDFTAVNQVCFTWTKYIAFTSSYWIAAAVSLERCVCVTLPFQVRRLFTRARCVTAIVLIVAGNTALHVPIYLTQVLVWKEVPASLEIPNSTKAVLEIDFLPEFGNILLVVDAADVWLMVTCQVIITVSAVLMIKALKTSSVIRNNTTLPGTAESRDKAESGPGFRSDVTSLKGGVTLSERERKLIKLVALLACYQTLCNIPHFAMIALYQMWMRYLNEEDALFKLQLILWRLSDLFHVVCAAISVLVYWRLNVGYRRQLREIFGDNKGRGSGDGGVKPSKNWILAVTKAQSMSATGLKSHSSGLYE